MAFPQQGRWGIYDVTALIGEGGMGQVYQATDTKLNRQVALEVLPEAFATDPDRLARFQREAQVLASLNHPNIAAIYGLEEADGVRALVLELVEGPTLADRIKQGPIPLDEALPIAKQIAEALEAAHEAGVIHRDLKPANVKVKDDGTVKVLDFGLAKALDPSPTGDPSQSPTLTAAATQMGVIMGTAAYMSPEQASGETTDKRGDIWSFGVVLFEMLTGQRLFTGKTVSHILASVLKIEPDWKVLPTTTPQPLTRLLRRCLEKEPKRRLRDVSEAVIHLEEAASAPAGDLSVAATTALQTAGWRQALPLVVGVSVVAVVITGLAVWNLMRPAPRPPVRFAITLPTSDQLVSDGGGHSVALSPDGATLVYVATRGGVQQLYRRPLDQLEAGPLPGTEGAINPVFSPDGEWIGFTTLDGTLKKIALAGGPPATLYNGPSQATDPSWGTNDMIVFGFRGTDLPFMQVASAGGVAEPVTTLADGESDHRQPQLLPGGTALLFSVASRSDEARIAVKSLDTGERRDLLAGSTPNYVSSGHIVFAREDALWAVPFDVDRLEVTGEAVPLPEGVGVEDVSGLAHFTLARNGSLAYIPADALRVEPRRTLVWVDREGREESVAAPLRAYGNLDISPDGALVAVDVRDPETQLGDIWLWDLARETLDRLTLDPRSDRAPVWTPDGRRVVFSSLREGVVCRNSADRSRGLSIVEIEQSAETLPPSNVCFQTDRRRCSLKKLVLASLMIPLPMVVLHILVDEPSQVAFPQRDHSAETLVLDRPDKPLRIGIEIGTPCW